MFASVRIHFSYLLTGLLVISPTQSPRVHALEDSGLKTSPKLIAVFRPVVAKATRSIVEVRCDDKAVSLGTVVGVDGWILTKASELKGPVVCKLPSGKELPAKLIGAHKKCDLALLKIEAKGLTPIEWRTSKKALPGDWLATPGQDADPVAVGVVSVSTRNPGPREMPPSLPAPSAGFLGVALEEAEGGPKIAMVTEGSAAAKAGLEVNDVVVSVAGKKIVDAETLMNTIGRYKPGDVVTIKIKRDGEAMEFEATLGKRPRSSMSRADFQNRLGGSLSNRRGGFPTVLQHDTVLLPKHCGGPLVGLDGKALGINIARAGRTETYAIPSELILTLIPELKSGKHPPEEDEKPASKKKD
jgi:serine protease Do